jgi:uncharacterized metal-binding protein
LPAIGGLTFGITKSSDLTLMLAGGFLFSGLMFGPDLDIRSRQFQRWGWLRWIWIPYQKTIRHRSLISHGFILGTLGRSLYLSIWLAALWLLGLAVFQLWSSVSWNWQQELVKGWQFLKLHYPQAVALFVGLELGAMSHSLSDWIGSAYKRQRHKRH